jgi:uncharacterized metal-binding protein YceD (DUF177 family)
MSEQSHYIIELSKMPLGTHKFDFQLDNDFFASLEKTEILSGNISAKVTLNLREEDYQLSIAVHGTVFVVCDRCLDPMPLEINDEQEIRSEEEEEFSIPNSQYSIANRTLDLSWLAYEIVSISIPLVHCHPEGGCNPQMDLLLQSHLCDEPDPEN